MLLMMCDDVTSVHRQGASDGSGTNSAKLAHSSLLPTGTLSLAAPISQAVVGQEYCAHLVAFCL